MGKGTLVDALSSASVKDTENRSFSELPIMTDGQTASELAGEIGKNVEWVRERLKALAESGQLLIGRRQVLNLMGRKAWAPVYKIVAANGTKKPKR